jgi:hypothetical protein
VAWGLTRKPGIDDLLGDEYSPIALRPSWSLLSIGFALLALTSRYWAWRLPMALSYWQRPLLAPVATVVCSGIGLAIALVIRRQGGLARFALFLNGVICGLIVLIIVAILLWWRLR